MPQDIPLIRAPILKSKRLLPLMFAGNPLLIFDDAICTQGWDIVRTSSLEPLPKNADTIKIVSIFYDYFSKRSMEKLDSSNTAPPPTKDRIGGEEAEMVQLAAHHVGSKPAVISSFLPVRSQAEPCEYS